MSRAEIFTQHAKCQHSQDKAEYTETSLYDDTCIRQFKDGLQKCWSQT